MAHRPATRTVARRADVRAAFVFLAATAAILAGMWWLQDGKPGTPTPAGIISTSPH